MTYDFVQKIIALADTPEYTDFTIKEKNLPDGALQVFQLLHKGILSIGNYF